MSAFGWGLAVVAATKPGKSIDGAVRILANLCRTDEPEHASLLILRRECYSGYPNSMPQSFAVFADSFEQARTHRVSREMTSVLATLP